MSDTNELGGDGGAVGTSNRREVLRTMGVGAVGAGVLWTTPVIMSAPAGAAATAPPGGCDGCGLDAVVNGSFEDGFAGWSPVGTIDYAYLVGVGALTGPPSGPGVVPGTNLAVMNSGSTTHQTIAIEDACVGAPYAFGVWAIGLQGAASITVTFVGSDGTGDLVIDVPKNNFPATMQPFNRTGTIPAGTTAVTITASTPDVINKLFLDLVSFVIDCSA